MEMATVRGSATEDLAKTIRNFVDRQTERLGLNWPIEISILAPDSDERCSTKHDPAAKQHLAIISSIAYPGWVTAGFLVEAVLAERWGSVFTGMVWDPKCPASEVQLRKRALIERSMQLALLPTQLWYGDIAYHTFPKLISKICDWFAISVQVSCQERQYNELLNKNAIASIACDVAMRARFHLPPVDYSDVIRLTQGHCRWMWGREFYDGILDIFQVLPRLSSDPASNLMLLENKICQTARAAGLAVRISLQPGPDYPYWVVRTRR